MSVALTDTALVARGEAAFLAARRQRRLATLGAVAVLALCVLLAARVSEFYPATLAAGLPRVGEYFYKLLPSLRWDALLSGPGTEGSIAFWFYRIDDWAWLLLQTSQMAALATLAGAGVALLLAFPAEIGRAHV